MVRYSRFALALGVCLLFSASASAWVITDNGLVRPAGPGYVPLGTPGNIGGGVPPTGSYMTWWHDGGPPHGGTIANDDCNVFPDKNHDVSSWADVIVPTSVVNSYMRRLDSTAIPGTLASASYGDLFGDWVMGDYQDLRSATDHVFPEGTQGTPLHIVGDNQMSGVVFYDVKDALLAQFFSCDKNDGYMEVVLNGVVIDRIDTWTQGWWYFELTGLNPNVADTVMLRTYFDNGAGTSIPSAHINTLDLNAGSENWLHRLPGNAGYPNPDDFHIFYIAYNYIEVPEPATIMLLGTGLAAGAWLRRRRRRTG